MLTSVNAYGLNGQGADAINLYYQMSNNQRDEISHVAVLNACSHSGLVDPARSIFNKIDNKSQIIYTTMVCFVTFFLLVIIRI